MGWWPCGACGDDPGTVCDRCVTGTQPANLSLFVSGIGTSGLCSDTCDPLNGTFVVPERGDDTCFYRLGVVPGVCGGAIFIYEISFRESAPAVIPKVYWINVTLFYFTDAFPGSRYQWETARTTSKIDCLNLVNEPVPILVESVSAVCPLGAFTIEVTSL